MNFLKIMEIIPYGLMVNQLNAKPKITILESCIALMSGTLPFLALHYYKLSLSTWKIGNACYAKIQIVSNVLMQNDGFISVVCLSFALNFVAAYISKN